MINNLEPQKHKQGIKNTIIKTAKYYIVCYTHEIKQIVNPLLIKDKHKF